MTTARVIKRLLALVGKDYEPAPDLPLSLCTSIVAMRILWMARGIVRLRGRVFVGHGVRLRGKRGLRLGRYATLEPFCQIDGYAQNGVSLGARSKLGSYTIVSCTSHFSKFGVGLKIGSDCGVSEFCYFGASGGIQIGDNVIMGQYVSFHSENHHFDNPDQLIRSQGVSSEGIIIGDNVWIGARVTILDGTVIGEHSVIAAGAVVRGKFPPHSLIGGIPAKTLKAIGAGRHTEDDA